jgi:hypothetical protein
VGHEGTRLELTRERRRDDGDAQTEASADPPISPSGEDHPRTTERTFTAVLAIGTRRFRSRAGADGAAILHVAP